MTKKKFDEYKAVQRSGVYNMYDGRARELTSLSITEWVDIMRNYTNGCLSRTIQMY